MSMQAHGAQASHEESHPGPGQYIAIAVVLSAITAVEVAIYYVDAIRSILVPLLLILSAVKFTLVVGYYMHLKFDSKLFTAFFGTGLFIAASTILALMALFGAFGGGTPHP